MSISPITSLAPMLRKLERWAPFNEDDRAAVLALPHITRRIDARHLIAREGEPCTTTCVLLSGFAIRHKIAGDGGRQILSLHMAGDIVDLQNSLLGVADHNVEAVGRVEAALLPVATVTTLAADRPAVGRALWRETLVEGSIFRESLLNVGRRDAWTRTAHLLCELALRLEAAGLGAATRFQLPLTQEQLGDMLGLTSIHVNRMLRLLAEDGLIARGDRWLTIPDWRRLASAGDFHPGYLHLDGAAPPAAGLPAAYDRAGAMS